MHQCGVGTPSGRGHREPAPREADEIQETRVNRIIRVAALGGALALALAACGSAPEDESTASSSSSATSEAGASDFKGCIVSDSGGFNDKSFNESGLNGLNQVK